MAVASVHIIFLLAMALGSGGVPVELAQFIEPADYFAPRNVEVKPESLLAVATKAPADAKEGFKQLLAIRWLGDNKDQLGSSKEAVRKGLQQLAEGRDEAVKDYARTALARIDGKPAPARVMPKNSVRLQALEWFPQEVTLASALDLRALPGKEIGAAQVEAEKLLKHVQAEVNKLIPNTAKDEIYIFTETVGNVRLDRLAFAYAPAANGQRGKDHIYIRVTGQVNHARLVEYAKQAIPNGSWEEKKGPKGEPITILKMQHSPLLVLVGDTDLLVCGLSGNPEGADALVETALEARAGKKPGASKGPLANLLKDVPEEILGMLVGNLPDDFRDEVARAPMSPGTPSDVVLLLRPAKAGKTGVEFTFQGTMPGEAEATKFVDTMKDLIKMGNEHLKEPPAFIPPAVVNLLKELMKMLDGLELKAEGVHVRATLPVTAETMKVLIPLIEEAVKASENP
jgi:hypothetical protein